MKASDQTPFRNRRNHGLDEEAEAEEAEEEEEEEMEMERRAFKLAHISRKLSENRRLYHRLHTRRQRKKLGSGRLASTRCTRVSGSRLHSRGSSHGD